MPEDDKEKEEATEIKEDEALVDATDAATVPLPDSGGDMVRLLSRATLKQFVVHLRLKKWATFTLFSKICFLLYAPKEKLKLKGRVLRGLTEWFPGVDSVSDLIPETWLPPLPPAITTLMKVYQDEEGDEVWWRTLKHDGGLIRLHEFRYRRYKFRHELCHYGCHVFVYDND